MKNVKPENIKVAVVAGFSLFILDLLTKLWAAGPAFKPVVFIKNFFYLGLQLNSGIAFGIPLPRWLQIMASAIILVILFRVGNDAIFRKNRRRFFKSAFFGIIIGGALGNLVNRVMVGYVTDFIVLKPFPTFNIADIGVTAGLVLLFVSTLFDQNKNGRKNTH